MPDVEALNLSGWETIITAIAQGLHNGTIKSTDLSKAFILKTAGELTKAVDIGFGTSYRNEGEETMAELLKQNSFLFSAAKNIAMQHEMAEMMLDEKGNIKPFSNFKEAVLEINDNYNKLYLQAEYQTVLSSSQAAKKWQDIERRKERFPNLQYRTVGDERVREEHAALEGIIRPVDHAFWNNYYPPNGWRCRCYVTQTDRPTNGDDVPVVNDKTVPKDFRQNVGKTSKTFKVTAEPGTKDFMRYAGTTPKLSKKEQQDIAKQLKDISGEEN